MSEETGELSELLDGLSEVDPLTVDLGSGELELIGRLPTASNGTFLSRLERGDERVLCVYKPTAGERPLWDFPDRTLGLREVAAHELSRVAGFDVVPRTVLVEGPLGPGSLQAWVRDDEADDEVVDLVPLEQAERPGWFAVLEGLGARGEEVVVVHADDPRLRRLALFDAVANNADRKGGHILTRHGHLFGVDHGLTFHPAPKLRTLLWGWADEELTEEERALVGRVLTDGCEALAELLTEPEIVSLELRCTELLRSGRFPAPDPGHHTVPWPPF
ncbi:SCO1664 family protein [Desertihabitans aurantiacus]|uniref:SCO1664 family protein n=1 Tax=Desertihabitans aurantiacus TaxID=2282477 RepID=UPI001E3A3900|nr:SCO1664 family protein [Desertihabitans aurantiacus]